MFYRQSLQNINVVVLTLDGGLLDLNHLRYFYLKKQGKLHNENISIEQFDSHIGNYLNMYDFLGFDFDQEAMEQNLFEYVKYTPGVVKSGVEELLKFLNTKGIRVAVYTTYKAKRAIQYLQLCKLEQYVDYVIGGDSECQVLPNNEIIDLIISKFNIKNDELLVAANFKSMVTAANLSYTNVIYLTDLVEPTITIERMVYRLVRNCFEIINLFLFDRFDDVTMFGEALNFSDNMDETELEKTYVSLIKQYGDDPELLRLVRKAYFYYLGELQNRHFEVFAKDRINPVDYPKLNEGLLFEQADQELGDLKDKIEQAFDLGLGHAPGDKTIEKMKSELDFNDFLKYGQQPEYIKLLDDKRDGETNAIDLDFTTEVKKADLIELELLNKSTPTPMASEKVQLVAKGGKFDEEQFPDIEKPLGQSHQKQTPAAPSNEEFDLTDPNQPAMPNPDDRIEEPATGATNESEGNLESEVLAADDLDNIKQLVKEQVENDPNVTQNQKETLDLLSALETREIDKKELQAANGYGLDHDKEFYLDKRGFFARHKYFFYPLFITAIGFGLYYITGAPFENQTGILETLDSILDFYLDGVVALFTMILEFINGYLPMIPTYETLMASEYALGFTFLFYFIVDVIIFDMIYTVFKFIFRAGKK